MRLRGRTFCIFFYISFYIQAPVYFATLAVTMSRYEKKKYNSSVLKEKWSALTAMRIDYNYRYFNAMY